MHLQIRRLTAEHILRHLASFWLHEPVGYDAWCQRRTAAAAVSRVRFLAVFILVKLNLSASSRHYYDKTLRRERHVAHRRGAFEKQPQMRH